MVTMNTETENIISQNQPHSLEGVSRRASSPREDLPPDTPRASSAREESSSRQDSEDTQTSLDYEDNANVLFSFLKERLDDCAKSSKRNDRINNLIQIYDKLSENMYIILKNKKLYKILKNKLISFVIDEGWQEGEYYYKFFEIDIPKNDIHNESKPLKKQILLNNSIDEDFLKLNEDAYSRIKNCVFYSIKMNITIVEISNIGNFYSENGYSWNWDVFAFGEWGETKRDRSFWTKRNILLPFDKVRRDLFKEYGFYLVMVDSTTYIFKNLQQVNDEFPLDTSQYIINYKNRKVRILTRSSPTVSANTFNILPF